MRIAFVILVCFLFLPLSGQRKWERMCGKFDKHYARSDFAAALEDAFGILEFSRENYDSTDGRSALSNYYVARAYEAMGDPDIAKPYIKNSHALLVPNMAYDEFTVEVSLLYGKIETELGFHKSAGYHLSNALEISLDLFGSESLSYLQTLYAMAELEMAMARWDQMISILTDALQIHERNFPLDQAYALYANYMGLLFMNSELMQEAILYLSKALAAYQGRTLKKGRALKKDRVLKKDLTCANANNNLGLILYYQSDFEEAALHFEEAASIYRKFCNGYSENYMMLLSNRASLYEGWGKVSLRESSYKELGEYLDLYAGRMDLPYIQGLENMAGFHASAGNFKEAEAFYLMATEARKGMHGTTSPAWDH